MSVDTETSTELVVVPPRDDTGALVPPPETIVEARALAVEALEAARWAVTALRYEVKLRTDWRTHFRKHPGVFLGTALLFGFLLGNRHRS